MALFSGSNKGFKNALKLTETNQSLRAFSITTLPSNPQVGPDIQTWVKFIHRYFRTEFVRCQRAKEEPGNTSQLRNF